MARAPVMAAGGIVLRRGSTPLIAVVRQRKRNEWVLPKGKLDDGETPKEAAHREVLEETGHNVAVHEFLGTLVYQSGGRTKAVHFWRMEADGGPVRKLMNDIKAVDWLTLEDAISRLSREYERAFLTQVGPIALAAAGLASSPPPTPPATDDIDAALQTLTPAEAASVDELRHGLLQKVKAWLRGDA
ncbi:NUDIX hydrolase [Bradyrhizobium genosp. SA-3]|uniref:NUDIX hydrolase n=1 Tax=Bradyrhizobium genosp. SA-3 TaxID=508868 RepID=UPI001029FF8E|nr:NUDIX hydrolase [Bradyrhizobium genosp. SA-3]RZN07658.1 NUDIX hydrolase [Bradyrhizobium genosp. SA-3]